MDLRRSRSYLSAALAEVQATNKGAFQLGAIVLKAADRTYQVP